LEKPLLICLTATRNYGWVTRAFLKSNSLWADLIIIADQHSTDGTREIASEFSNVILLDNDNLKYSETERSKLLIDRARQIRGNKILIFLAIDEVFSANFSETMDWQKVQNSKKGDVFFFQWANIFPDSKHYWLSELENGSPMHMARMFHDDDITPYNNEGLDMHTHCIPYPKDDSNCTYYVNDFKILHFGDYNINWNNSKQRFYQFVDFNQNKRSSITLSRMYKRAKRKQLLLEIPENWIYHSEKHGFNLFSEIDVRELSFFDNYVLEFLESNGVKHYKKLHVWDKELLNALKLKDPRNLRTKIVHFYLEISRNHTKSILTRAIDKLLKFTSI
jgi:hypothetical protein